MSATCPKCRTIIETSDTAFTLQQKLNPERETNEINRRAIDHWKQRAESAERDRDQWKERSERRVQDIQELARRLESAEQRNREAMEQEPLYYHADCTDVDRSALCNNLADAQTLVNDYGGKVEKLYAAPITPADVVQRMMRRLAELLDEDKFAEMESIAASGGIKPPADVTELRRLLDEARRQEREAPRQIYGDVCETLAECADDIRAKGN